MSDEAQVISYGKVAEDLMKATAHEKPKLPGLRRTLTLLAVMCSFPALVLWSKEVWLRPQFLQPVENYWLAGVVVAGIFLAMFTWPNSRKRGWWLRASIGTMLAVVSIGAGRFIRDEVTVRHLIRHEKGHLERWEKLRQREVKTDLFSAVRPMLDWFDGHGVWVPPVQNQGEDFPYHTLNFSLERLLETCSWRVRSEFMRRMMQDEEQAAFLVRDWHRIFPAVTGQDVNLGNRTQLMQWLDLLADDATAAKTNRDAATFWMALIVLTDPESFQNWRVPVRDRMLATEEPPMNQSGDVWMRMLDLLLVFDSRNAVIALSGQLMQDPLLMRRALRERMRGLEGHMDAIMDEIENHDASGNSQIATSMWVDLRHLTESLPDAPERTQIRSRLNDVMVNWLIGEALKLGERFSNGSNYRHIISQDIVMDLSAEQRTRLKAFSYEILEDVRPSQKQKSRHGYLPARIEQALLIRHYLDHEDQKSMAEKIARILMHNEWKPGEGSDLTEFDPSRFIGFSGIWSDLTEDTKHCAGRWMRQHLHTLDRNVRAIEFMHVLSRMDQILPYLSFDEADRLSLKLCFESASGNSRFNESLWWTLEADDDEPPRFSAAAIEEFIASVEHAVANKQVFIIIDPGKHELRFGSMVFRSLPIRYPQMSPRDAALCMLVGNGLVSPDGLFKHLSGAPQFFGEKGRSTMWRDSGYENFPEWYDDVMQVRAALNAWDKQDWSGVSRLIAHLEGSNLNREVLNLVYSNLMNLSEYREMRDQAFNMLFRIEERLNPANRDILRQAAWGSFHVMEPSLMQFSIRWDEAALRGRAGRISWRDDALSAKHGWASHIGGELHFWQVYNSDPPKAISPPLTFQYLLYAREVSYWAWGIDYYQLDRILPNRAWLTAPPELPLEPTPWQRARELYLKRPDLEFPDRGQFRPSR